MTIEIKLIIFITFMIGFTAGVTVATFGAVKKHRIIKTMFVGGCLTFYTFLGIYSGLLVGIK